MANNTQHQTRRTKSRHPAPNITGTTGTIKSNLVLRLKFAGFPIEEIAEQAQIPTVTVRSILRAAGYTDTVLPLAAITTKEKPAQQSRTGKLLSLLSGAFWEPILASVDPEVALYAFFLLSGASQDQALTAVFGQGKANLPSTTARLMEEAAQPIIVQGLALSGINDFWLGRLIRTIGEDPAQDADVRLRAAELAARLTGRLGTKETTLTGIAATLNSRPGSQQGAVDSRNESYQVISQTIRETVGHLVTIPKQAELIPQADETVDVVEARVIVPNNGSESDNGVPF